MKSSKYLNAYHRDYCKRTKRAAALRSKQPSISGEEFIQQVSRLRVRGFMGDTPWSLQAVPFGENEDCEPFHGRYAAIV